MTGVDVYGSSLRKGEVYGDWSSFYYYVSPEAEIIERIEEIGTHIRYNIQYLSCWWRGKVYPNGTCNTFGADHNRKEESTKQKIEGETIEHWKLENISSISANI